MSEYRFENTVSGKLVAALRDELIDALIVPNTMLPVEFHGHNEIAHFDENGMAVYGRPMAELEKQCEKRDKNNRRDELLALRAARIEHYAICVEDGEDIDYYPINLDDVAEFNRLCPIKENKKSLFKA